MTRLLCLYSTLWDSLCLCLAWKTWIFRLSLIFWSCTVCSYGCALTSRWALTWIRRQASLSSIQHIATCVCNCTSTSMYVKSDTVNGIRFQLVGADEMLNFLFCLIFLDQPSVWGASSLSSAVVLQEAIVYICHESPPLNAADSVVHVRDTLTLAAFCSRLLG